MSVIKAKLVLSRDQLPTSRQDLSVSRTEHQDCSDSSIKSSSDVRQLVSIFREFLQTNKRSAQNPPAPPLTQDLEPRDRPVVIPLPSDEHLLSRESLERYVTELCGMVWSRAFYYYSTNQLSFQNTKIYSSQQILQNLSRLCEKYALQAKDFALIDRHLQGSVLEYMLNKYPMTLSQEINRNLNNSIREFDDTDNVAHSFLHGSCVVFKYRECGEYNDLIMRTINQAINCIEARVDNKSVFQRFEDKMTLLFESVTDYEWMHKRQEQREEEHDGQWLLSLTLNNQLQRKVTLDENALKNEYVRMKEKEKSTYEEKVKQYTHYKINKKLPESTRLFTEGEISSHRLKIESPQILRILTKWCSELEKKFQCTGCFQHFIEGVSLEKSAFLSLMLGEVRESLSELISQEKAKIQQELAELAENNFYMQSELLMRKLVAGEFSQIDRYERISAQFSIDIVNNLHSYIIAYLNRLIHGLLTVFKRFQQLPAAQQLQIPSNSSIITFQVMDLVRCKCSSREKEILKIYHQLVRKCEENENMSLVRVVNRLKKGTNDILINIKYRNVLCEVQLAVTNKDNSFLEYSNAFNHYLYELKRSVFGPLTELSGIWKNLDSRFNTYTCLDAGALGGTQGLGVEDHRCRSECEYLPYNRPFVCSLCSQHYFHNKFVKKHIKCRDCDFWVCARCQIKRSDCTELLATAFQNQEVVKKCRKLDSNAKSVPNYGMCIYVESQEIVIQPFRKYTNEKSIEKVIGIKSKSIYQIYDTSTEKQRHKFMSKFLIFQLDDDFGSRHIKITNEAVKQYLIEEKFKHILAKNKDTVNLNNEHLTSGELERLFRIGKNEQKNRIKNVQLIGNQITTCKAIAEEFQNVARLQLSKNRVTDFTNVAHMSKLQKIVLNDNDLKTFPEEICLISGIKEISLNQNSIKVIPPSLEKCRQLTSLHMTSNKLTEIPAFIFQMRNLAEFSATSNFIKQIPQSIQLAKRLRYLSIQNNYIKSIPRQIEFLVELERLNLSHNKIAEIPMLATLRALKHLNLRHNSIGNIDDFLNTPMNIREVDLSYNAIKAADKIDNFPILKFLNLSHNELTSFPVFGRSCSNLKHLLISNNKLSKMGTFENLISLEEVQLSDNMFEEIHSSLAKLQNLVIVHAQSNHLKTLNNLQMEHVIKLFLKRNQITEIKGLHMKNLQQLDVSQNELACFEFNFLPKLKKINLNINKLKNLQLSSYLKISVVQAARNQLSRVPNFHSNNQIKFLNLEHNDIEEIPRPMMASNHISTLNLSNNKIKVIPKELQNLSTLKNKSLYLQKNPLQIVECLNFITNKCGYDITNDIKGQDKNGQDRSEIMESQTQSIKAL